MNSDAVDAGLKSIFYERVKTVISGSGAESVYVKFQKGKWKAVPRKSKSVCLFVNVD